MFGEGYSARGIPLFIHSPQDKRFAFVFQTKTEFVELTTLYLA
ncbi:unnamed protein product [marine sediment metagenome]|uniref:Uncharacterized protein n=1 Tax=marine sediment metagenome TaxID=412755 RepID=X1RFD1_9ZZZZ